MSGQKTALITGITGQDGAYLADFLLGKGYAVHGLVRRDGVDGGERLDALGVRNRVVLHDGDMTDPLALAALLKAVSPDEIYNLAAQTHVQVSFATPASTFAINALGTLNLLDAVRVLGMQGDVRLYQASSSEMFGQSPPPQNEETPFQPCSPYGAAKLAAHWLCRTYRAAYGLHVSNGILFNHESPLRGEDFVTRKITRAVAAIEAGAQDILTLGNLDALRDWGHARDHVRGMWLMLQRDEPDDYVLATGRARSVREFAERAFAQAGMTIEWQGGGLQETGINKKTRRIVIKIDKTLFRPREVHSLLGDASKARDRLGWRPEISFDTMVTEMVDADRETLLAKREGESWQKMAG